MFLNVGNKESCQNQDFFFCPVGCVVVSPSQNFDSELKKGVYRGIYYKLSPIKRF